MKYFLIIIGVLFTVIGFAGVLLPLLPTTPFLLVAVLCFSKSSDKFEKWLVQTKVYVNYVESFKENKGYTLKDKFKLLLSLYIVIGFSIFMIDHPYIRLCLLVMVTLQTIVLFTFVKTLPANFYDKK
ncbi:YbaN family protein [Staphylococcus equorum]|uniref:YbaN family protein n=1 Tax=Staphylococcus equorum TaxID=246432 RepID=A0A9X4QYH6_9STAP|nr:YbaN family protein [Staphylococcus equorum]MDG0820107.1 YbaN family protein [Staphylococcus equorum]MDG0840620.1 YbaN family protein [Staphylococcus equorum]MDG0846431.1 YbaN family protein [Staphylococcus equorum]